MLDRTICDAPVLVVDLDGTLCRSDTLLESLLRLLREQPGAVLLALWQLRRGRAAFKAWIAERALPDPALLPLEPRLLNWLREQRAAGRRIELASAADRRIAVAVAEHLGLFDAVLASDGHDNLKGGRKAEVLIARHGERGFDYAGDSRADLAVWARCRQAVVVGGPALQRAAAAVAEVGKVFAPERSRWAARIETLRPHQWAKNLLLFLPLLAAHRYDEPAALLAALLAFVAFSLMASAVYVANDLNDLAVDRQHPSKRARPLASGALPLHEGLAAVPLLVLAAIAVSPWLPWTFGALLVVYLLLSSLYTFRLKRSAPLDVLTLATLYTLRILAGAAALEMVPSFWLLALSMCLFLSLALVKRYAELDALAARGGDIAAGRGWQVGDRPLVSGLGAAAGMAAVLVLALYIDSPPARKLYATPQLLWLACPLLLYWICRVWLKAHRGQMHEDPVVFAMRDRASLATGVLLLLIAVLATTVTWRP